MKRRNVALFPLLALAVSACADQMQPQIDVAAEEQAVRAVSTQWLALEKAKDAAGIAALFAADGVIYREGAEPSVGPAAIQAYLVENYAANPSEVVGWTTDKVEIAAGGDVAVEHGTWTVTGAGPNGSESDHGKYLTAYRKTDAGWKVTADMSSSTKPESGPPAT